MICSDVIILYVTEVINVVILKIMMLDVTVRILWVNDDVITRYLQKYSAINFIDSLIGSK